MQDFYYVPKTGFEPARRFQRDHLKVVRLPVSPPGQWGMQNYEKNRWKLTSTLHK